ncbi:MAG: hypothetical protein ACC661_03005 [Verrucomicrobiales bacterium]
MLTALVSAAAWFALAGASLPRLFLLVGDRPQTTLLASAVAILGLGAGALLAPRLCRSGRSPGGAIAGLQGILGAWVLALPLLLLALELIFPALATLCGPGRSELPALLAIFATLALPALLAGASLALASRGARPANAIGGTMLGAGCAAAAIPLLHRELGIAGGGWAAIAGAVVVGVFALASSRPTGTKADRNPARIPFVSGLLLAAAITLSFRPLALVLGPDNELLPHLFLTLPLLSAGLGALLLGRLSRPSLAPTTLFAAGLALLANFFALGLFPEFYLAQLAGASRAAGDSSLPLAVVIAAGAAMGLPSFFLGAALPLGGTRLPSGQVGSTPNPLNLPAAALGAATGFLLWELILVPAAGARTSLAIAAALGLVAAIITAFRSDRTPRLRTILPLLALFIGLVCATLAEPWDQKTFALLGSYRRQAVGDFDPGRFGEVLATSTLAVSRATPGGGSIAVLRGHQDRLHLLRDGAVIADTHSRSLLHQRLLGHLPMLLHPGEPHRVLSLGLGSGVTAGALAAHPGLETLHCIESRPANLLAADTFADHNRELLENPVLELHFTAARAFLRSSGETFDLICCATPAPGDGSQLTAEFFTLARARLGRGGLFCQSLPAQRFSPRQRRRLLTTFASVFPAHLRFATAGGGDILIGGPSGLPVDPTALARRFASPGVGAALAEIGFARADQLWAGLIHGPEDIHPADTEGLYTDNLPLRLSSATGEPSPHVRLAALRATLKAFDAADPFRHLAPKIASATRTQRTAFAEALRASLKLAEGELNAALARAKKALAAAPENPLVRLELAPIYGDAATLALRTQDSETSFKLLQAAYDLEPHAFNNLYRLALAKLHGGDEEGALPLLGLGIVQFPRSPYFYALQANLARQKGNYPQALDLHRLALERAPGLDSLWEQYQRCAEASGDRILLEKVKKERLRSRD